MEKKKLLEVKNLTTAFTTDEKEVIAVNNISFTLYRGETLGIVGESGSGKSVTALSILKLIPNPPGRIKSGEIIYYKENGQPIILTTLPEKEMRKIRGNEIAMIFQEPMTSLNPVFTCGDQVVEAIILHQKKSKDVAKNMTLQLFKHVKISDPERAFHSYPHQLSGGQKQRVMIAMGMSCKPSLLIADEPTTALDVTVQKTILELMKTLRKELETSFLFITHDLGVIGEIADRVLVMYKGKIVEEGSVLKIFENPVHPYTKGLIACRPPLDTKLKYLPTISDFMVEEENGQVSVTNQNSTDLLRSLQYSPTDIQRRVQDISQAPDILFVKNLKVWYPARTDFWGRTQEYTKAVDGVSFNMKLGETLGLVGESGCGKTTLGKAILRLTPAHEGEILYKGNDILQLSKADLKELRKEVQIIFQDPYSSLNPRMTIGQAIKEPMIVHEIYSNDKEREDKVLELLQKVNLRPEHYNRYPHEFSGGQRQRICIARALSLNPKFIVCDESVSALDVSVQAQVLNLLVKLREEFQLSYIFISHDLSVVKFISDRMMVMQNGKIEEFDNAEMIYLHPSTEYTKKLIQSIPKGSLDEIRKRFSTSAKMKS